VRPIGFESRPGGSLTLAIDSSTINGARASLAIAEQSMRRRTADRWLACLLAPLVLVANAAPVGTMACKASGRAAASPKTCCGCCQARKSTSQSESHSALACCAKPIAAKPKCCCQKGPRVPAAPAPVPDDSQRLVKQTLVSDAATPCWPTMSDSVAVSGNRESSSLDIAGPPVRVLFCVWLI
jgi:hypothetical protein